jgi:hypothetical protein
VTKVEVGGGDGGRRRRRVWSAGRWRGQAVVKLLHLVVEDVEPDEPRHAREQVLDTGQLVTVLRQLFESKAPASTYP